MRAGAAGAPAPEVRIENFAFAPAALEVAAGATGTWDNGDAELHTVTSSDGRFTSPGIDEGGHFSFRFDTPGRYEYRCALHPQMHGVVVVR
jgi:plastocyanin